MTKLGEYFSEAPADISLADIDMTRIPHHVSIIMDGNGRWAQARGLDRSEGHIAGVASLRETVTTSVRLGLDVLSAYAFSTENWKRPQHEVDMRIPIQYALSYPERWKTPVHRRINWCSESPVTFGEPDEDTFGCLSLAKEAGRAGGTLPCALNAANEVANLAFRRGVCGFLDIERVVGRVMDVTSFERVETLQQLSEVDARSRELASSILSEVAR